MSAPFYLSYAALWALVVFQTLVVIGLVKALHEYRSSGARPGDLAAPAADGGGLAGQPAPDFDVEDLRGRSVTNVMFPGRPTALLFVSPDCSSCAVTLQELEALQAKMEGRVIVICRSETHRCEALAANYGLELPVVADPDRVLSDLYRITAPPTAVLIAADGRIESYGHPMSADELQALIDRERGNGRSDAGAGDLAVVQHEPNGGAR
jgi:peroxiredoxin